MAVLALVVGACAGDPHRGDGRLQIAWQGDARQRAGEPMRLAVQVSEIDWSPRNGLHVTVTAHLGADSLPPVDLRGRGAGLYALDGFVFPTAGAWTLTARATRPDGRWTERDRDVEVAPE